MKVFKAYQQRHFFDLRQVRVKVFVIGQGVPIEIELDDKDPTATHIVAYNNDTIVGTARIVVENQQGKVGRVAVLNEYQGLGVGALLMKQVEEEAKLVGVKKLILNAQCQVEEFYQKLDYMSVGDYFYEANIKHISMKKHL